MYTNTGVQTPLPIWQQPNTGAPNLGNPMYMLGYNRYPNANNPVNVQQMMSQQQVNLDLKFIQIFFSKITCASSYSKWWEWLVLNKVFQWVHR
jgi:hypothetical protein